MRPASRSMSSNLAPRLATPLSRSALRLSPYPLGHRSVCPAWCVCSRPVSTLTGQPTVPLSAPKRRIVAETLAHGDEVALQLAEIGYIAAGSSTGFVRLSARLRQLGFGYSPLVRRHLPSSTSLTSQVVDRDGKLLLELDDFVRGLRAVEAKRGRKDYPPSELFGDHLVASTQSERDAIFGRSLPDWLRRRGGVMLDWEGLARTAAHTFAGVHVGTLRKYDREGLYEVRSELVLTVG